MGCKRYMDEKNREKLKFWLEAGLALLLVLTLGSAGARGVFTKDAQGKSASIEAKEENGQGAEDEEGAGKEQKEKKETAEEVIADGQYPIMGESTVTVKRWCPFLSSQAKNIRQRRLAKGEHKV